MPKLLLTVNAWMKTKHAIRLLSKFDLSRSRLVNNSKVVCFVTLRNSLLRHTDIMIPPQRGAAC